MLAPTLDPVIELPSLDVSRCRRALADGGRCAVLASHRCSLLAHPRAEALGGLDPAFAFASGASGDGLLRELRGALRAGGLDSNKTIEALLAEIEHLLRTFGDVAGDAAPRVRLAMVTGTPGGVLLPPAGERPALALACSLTRPGDVRSALPVTGLAAVFGGEPAWPISELPAETAALLAFDRAGGAGVPAPAAAADPRLVLVASSRRVPQIPRPSRPHPPRQQDVVLVSMPFGALRQPSLGLSLLKATLTGVRAEVLYFTLPFARHLGVGLYEWITDCQPFVSALLGEWIFRPALFGQSPGDARRYCDEILEAPTRRWRADQSEEPSFITLVSEGVRDEVLRARAAAPGFVDACVDEILERRPKVVGITSVFQQHVASLALARRLKARAPEIAIVVGGANCEGVMGLETIRRFDFIDAVVCGEGDVVFPQLVERWLTGRPVDDLRGVYTATSPEAREGAVRPLNAPSPPDMDALPYPDFDDFFAQWKDHGYAQLLTPRLIFETARGCWWGEKQHCTFCGLNGTTMTFRSKSAERALDELRSLTSRHPGLFVGAADNILDINYFKTFLPRLAAENVNLELFYEVKSNLGKKQIRQLREAGVVEVQPGIESLSDDVLRIMRKGVTAFQNVQFLKWCQEIGVWPYWNLIWGFPGEPPEEYERMARLLPLLSHLPPPAGMSKIFLERFSPNYNESDALGFTDVRPTPAYGHLYPFPGESLERIAYYFSYEYGDGREIAEYTRPLAQRVVAWREAYSRSRLFVVDRGDHLFVYDSRPVATHPLSVIDGLARELYLGCAATTTIDRLQRRAAARVGAELSRDEISKTLEPLLEDGLMIRQGDRVLALALPGPIDGSCRNPTEEKPP